VGDAHGNLRLAEERNDDAMTANAFHLAFDAHEGALHDTDSPMLLTEEVSPCQGYALLIGIGQRLGLDEVLHFAVTNGRDGHTPRAFLLMDIHKAQGEEG